MPSYLTQLVLLIFEFLDAAAKCHPGRLSCRRSCLLLSLLFWGRFVLTFRFFFRRVSLMVRLVI